DHRRVNHVLLFLYACFFFQAEDGIRDRNVTGVQTCALPISVLRKGSQGGNPRSVEQSLPQQDLFRQVIVRYGNQIDLPSVIFLRSEERRVGKECRYRWSSSHAKKTRSRERRWRK